MTKINPNEDLPEPLVGYDCDMRGLPCMPLDVVRVIDSDLFALTTGDEFKAAFTLWAKSWNQLPAGSLPDDDRILSHLSQTGRDMSQNGPDWSQLKNRALHGWIKCSDGRLYHPVICAKALEILPKRFEQKASVTAEKDRKQRERDDRKKMFADLRAVGHVTPGEIKTRDLRDRWSRLCCDTSRNVTSEEAQKTANNVTHVTPVTDRPVTRHEPDTDKRREREERKKKEEENKHPTTDSARGRSDFEKRKQQHEPPGQQTKPDPDFQAFINAAGMANFPNDLVACIKRWRGLQISFDSELLPAVRKMADEMRGRGKPPFTAKVFDALIDGIAGKNQSQLDHWNSESARRKRLDEDQAADDLRKAREEIELCDQRDTLPDGHPSKPSPEINAQRRAKALAELERLGEKPKQELAA